MANRNWLDIAEKSFNDGIKQGITETEKNYSLSGVRKLKAELDELREYKRDMEATLEDPERLAELIGGL